MTELQYRIVTEYNPRQTYAENAERIGCSPNYLSTTMERWRARRLRIKGVREALIVRVPSKINEYLDARQRYDSTL